jgi:HK97 family phage major capsid protein
MRTYDSTMAEIGVIEASQRDIFAKAEPSADDKDFLLKAEGEIDALKRLASELHTSEIAALRAQIVTPASPVVGDKSVLRDALKGMKVGDEISIAPQASLASNTGSGAYLVPAEWHKSVEEYRFQRNFVRAGGAQVVQTESTHNIPVLTALAAAAIVGENTAYTAADPTIAQVILHAYKLTDKVAVSEELLEDAIYPVEAVLARALGLSFGAAEEAYFLTGTGSAQPTGIFNKAADKELTSPTAITTDELVEIAYGLARAYRNGASWMMDDKTVLHIAKLKEAVTTSGTIPYWWPQAQQGASPTLLGFPVNTGSDIADMAASAKVICFGNLGFYVIGERGPIKVKRLQLTEYGDTFAFSQRIDGVPLDTAAFYVAAQHSH